MSDSLIIQSKIRDVFKEAGCNTGSDAIDSLNQEVARIVKRAVERTKENGRKTVKSSDI